jgi:hypothetical protein
LSGNYRADRLSAFKMGEPKVKTKDKTEEAIVEVLEINMREAHLCFVGTSPMIQHRFHQKAWQQLLLPPRTTNRAERQRTLKHDPVAEFRGALYKNRDSARPSLFHIPSGSFAKAIAAAAIDLPGAKRAQIERLTRIADVNIDLFGVPNLFMSMVRNSDINRTPDVRTRPIFPQWAGKFTISFVREILTEKVICNLAGAAGHIVGIGDWRPQKGGPFGCFRLCAHDDPEYNLIVAKQGRKAQQAAFDSPIFHDEDTAELMAWFENEVATREMESKLSESAPGKRTRNKAKTPVVIENGHAEYRGVE